jgi:beta-glucosidase
MIKRCITGLAACCLLVLSVHAQPVKPLEARVDSVLRLMTLEEKVGQMNQYNGFWSATGPAPKDGDPKKKYDDLRAGRVGAVLNVQGVAEVRALQRIAVEETRLRIPLLFGCDVIHGYKTLSPIPLAEAASWDLAAIENSARMAALEASAAGINWTFAPMVDISRDARWGRVMEGAGEDPYLGSRIAVARVRGFQGDDLASPATVAACAKHFAGYGFVQAGRDYHHTDFSAHTLYNTILPPFKAAADAGVATFMNAFTAYNGIPSSADSFLMRNILKQSWKFPGMVVSDWGSIGEMQAHGYAANLPEAAQLAANAGCDMDMESNAYVQHLVAAVKSGQVKQAVVDEAVRRILRLKFMLGLFDDPYRYCNAQREATWTGHPNIRTAAKEMAMKSMVLLENKGILPLSVQDEVVLIGPLANDRTAPLGNWRVSSEDETAVPLTEGLQSYFPQLRWASGPAAWTGKALFHKAVQINETDTAGWGVALALAKNAKTVVLAMGEHGYQSGEGRSRTSIRLPGLQEAFLRDVLKQNKRVVLVLFAGRPLILPDDIRSQLGAILLAWQPGTLTGPAVADVLMGAYNPSGRLPMTFPRDEGQIPLAYNDYTGGRPGPSAEVFWSHYNDMPNTPQYPFGYGLSYTTFSYGEAAAKRQADGSWVFSVRITNTGKVVGKETVQLYVKQAANQQGIPFGRQLAGFEQVVLEPGKSAEVQITLRADALQQFNYRGEKLKSSGQFTAWLGPHAAVSEKPVIFEF